MMHETIDEWRACPTCQRNQIPSAWVVPLPQWDASLAGPEYWMYKLMAEPYPYRCTP